MMMNPSSAFARAASPASSARPLLRRKQKHKHIRSCTRIKWKKMSFNKMLRNNDTTAQLPSPSSSLASSVFSIWMVFADRSLRLFSSAISKHLSLANETSYYFTQGQRLLSNSFWELMATLLLLSFFLLLLLLLIFFFRFEESPPLQNRNQIPCQTTLVRPQTH